MPYLLQLQVLRVQYPALTLQAKLELRILIFREHLRPTSQGLTLLQLKEEMIKSNSQILVPHIM